MKEISKILLLGGELVKKHREVERLEAENKKLKAAIRKHCKDCISFRGQEHELCSICVLFEYREGGK